MPTRPPYLPRRQVDLAAWLANFSQLISADPTPYGLDPADASAIAATVAAWQAAFQPVLSPASKTRQAVAAKDEQTVHTLALIRPYALQIAGNRGVSVGDKVGLGLNPRLPGRTPIKAPNSVPILAVDSGGPRVLTLRYHDSARTPTVKAKPPGVTQLLLFGRTSPTPITLAAGLPLIKPLTKSPAIIFLDDYAPGERLYLAAQWATRAGALSGFSPIVSVTVSS